MDAPGVDIGTTLREQRERLGYSLKDAAEKTRIRKAYLENIEENNFSALPGTAYVRGFVDIYCRFLGLSSKQLLDSLPHADITIDSSPESLPTTGKSRTKVKLSPKAKSPKKLRWFLVIIVIAGLSLYMISVNNFKDSPVSVKETVQESQLKIDQTQKTADDKNAETSAASTSAAEVVKPSESQTENVVSNDQQATVSPLPSIPDGGASLRMLAIAEGSLIIYVDSRKAHHYQLHDGLDLTWKINRKVRVELNEFNAARFWLDDQEVDMSGLKDFVLEPPPKE